MTTDTTALVLNPALRVLRASDDEIVVRHGSRGRSGQRIRDDERRGILADLALSFSHPRAPETSGSEATAELLGSLLDAGVIVPESEASFGYLIAGLGRPLPPPSVESVHVVGEGQVADAAAAQVSEAVGAAVPVVRATRPDDLDDAEFILATADTTSLSFFFEINEYALTHGVRWHAAYVDGPEIVVGPLYIPGVTGCFHDFDVLDEAGRSLRIDHLYGKLVDGGNTPAGPLPLFVAHLAAGYLVTSVLQDIYGQGSFLEGYSLHIDLDRMEVIRRMLSRLARCPACQDQRPDLRHPFI